MWLGFFLCDVLQRFGALAATHGDTTLPNSAAARAPACSKHGAARLGRRLVSPRLFRRRHAARHGKRRGMPDRFDLAELVRAVRRRRSRARAPRHAGGQRASGAARDGLVQLLDPPFDKSALDPGYIRGYVPGVRENGGQYTHGAIWAAMAFAALGEANAPGNCCA